MNHSFASRKFLRQEFIPRYTYPTEELFEFTVKAFLDSEQGISWPHIKFHIIFAKMSEENAQNDQVEEKVTTLT